MNLLLNACHVKFRIVPTVAFISFDDSNTLGSHYTQVHNLTHLTTLGINSLSYL